MKKITIFAIRYKGLLSVLFLVFVLVAPVYFTSAAANDPLTLKIKIENPLGKSIDTLPKFIETILNIVLVVGVPIVALAIIYSGFLFVSAQGNSEKITEAKNTLKFTLIGAALLLGSWIIAQAIQGTIAEIKRTT